MFPSEHKRLILQWFEIEGGGSLLLPDGWFGRPYDNIHTITSIDETDHTVTIALDDNRTTLQFERLKSVKIDARDLIFSEFGALRFERSASGDQVKIKNYHDGQVRLVAPAQAGR